MVLRNVAGGWRLFTHPDTAVEVERFVLSSRQARLTKAALETLAIVAYKQPVTRHQITSIRGVNSDGVLRALQDKGLVEEAGREETPGRPALFATTPSFLERLGLPSLAALPSLAPLLGLDAEEPEEAGSRRQEPAEAPDVGAGRARRLAVPAERLQRLLARAGYGSRRACEELIVEGRVTLNGTVATLGDRGDPAEDEIRVDGLEVNLDPNVKYYALHKPSGVVTTMRDPQGRPDIRAYLPPDGPRVFPVGRLDRDTRRAPPPDERRRPRQRAHPPAIRRGEGVPGGGRGRATPKHLGLLRRGVDLEDGPASAANARVAGRSGDRGAVRLVMTEGRKREVRRLLAAVGLPVARLVRVRIGPVRLGTLGPGERRELTHDEVVALRRVVDG